MIQRTTKGILWTASVLAVAFGLLSFSGLPRILVLSAFDFVQLGASVTASVFAVLAARRLSGASRHAWTLLAIGTALWAVGQFVWTWYEIIAGIEAPFPSTADIGYLSFTVLAIAAILVHFYSRGRRFVGALGMLIDTALIVTTLLTLTWGAYLGPVIANAPDPASTAFAAVYLIGDVVAIGLLLTRFLRGQDAGRAGFGWLMVAFAGLAVADTGFAIGTLGEHYATGQLTDVGWLVGWFLLAAAAAEATTVDLGRTRPRLAISLVPIGCTLAVAIVGVPDLVRDQLTSPILYGGSVVMLLAIMRAALSSHEHLVASEQLEASGALTDAIFESIPAIIAIADTQGRLLRWNGELTRASGFTEAELAGKDVLEFIQEDGREALRQKLVALPAGGSATLEGKLRYKDGSLHDHLLTGRRIGAAERSLVVGIAVDVTERKRNEAKLRQTERLASLGTLVAGVAHEINNPLMYIEGSVQLIIENAKNLRDDPESSHGAIEEMLTDAATALHGLERIGAITKGLRQVARPASAARSQVSANSIAESILPVAGPRVGPNVCVETRFESTRLVECNANEISQVLLNLLLNAGDAMGGKPGTLTVATRNERDFVVLEVQDTGPGIPPEKQADIFTPFFTTKAHGTGLGLSVSRAIIANHGGELTFESSPAGTTFRVRLPAVNDRTVTP